MPQGTVKWFNAEKGLRLHRPPEDGSADVFVHYTEIQGSGFRTLEENQKVEFEVGQSPPKAPPRPPAFGPSERSGPNQNLNITPPVSSPPGRRGGVLCRGPARSRGPASPLHRRAALVSLV